MHKLAYLSGQDWLPHSHAALFATETASAHTPRIVAGVPAGDSGVLLRLIECLSPPFFVLYVLHTPRGEGSPGRYQSPELESAELQAFVSRFSAFLAGDARFDLWVHSPSTEGTLVWDRHNLIYGYGPVECFDLALLALGFSHGMPSIPAPHAHHYREELDADATAILAAFPWQHSPLRPEDDQ